MFPTNARQSRDRRARLLRRRDRATTNVSSTEPPAESPRRPPSHCTCPGGMVNCSAAKLADRGALAAGAGDTRPRLDRRRSAVAGADAGDLKTLAAMLEQERQHDAELRGLGREAAAIATDNATRASASARRDRQRGESGEDNRWGMIPRPSGALFPDLREVHDHFDGFLHVLHRHPLEARVEILFAREQIWRRQSHERQS
jgi:hypothetical protein